MKLTKIIPVIGLAALAACEQAPNASVEDLMAVDQEFSDYSKNHGPYAAWDKFLVDNAIGLSEGQDFSWDKATTMKNFENFPETASLTWTPLGGGIAASGELGYTYGRYVVKRPSAEGENRNSHGKYVTIWKLQEDGSWKVILDGGNSNPPPSE